MKAKLLKTNGPSAVATLVLPSRSEHCLTVSGRDDPALNRSLRDAAEERKAAILSRVVFTGNRIREKCRHTMAVPDGRVIWLRGNTGRNGANSSMQAVAVSGTHLSPVMLQGRDLGFVYEDDDALYCQLSGVHPESSKASRPEQTRAVFDIMQAALQEHGFRFTDAVRTWFYLDKIQEWYQEFNSVRTAFFESHGVFHARVPASTGIGVGNALGTALIANLLAVRPKTSRVTIEAVASPLQGSALNYKSSFSRAVEMTFPTHRSLLVSGTASINPDGTSAHVGNPARQVELTMRVVEALLRSRHMDWSDLFRGVVYFKNMEDRKCFERYCQDHQINAFPLAVARADICRRELLFEIEMDAVKAVEDV